MFCYSSPIATQMENAMIYIEFLMLVTFAAVATGFITSILSRFTN